MSYSPYIHSVIMDIMRLNSKLADAARANTDADVIGTLAAIRHVVTAAETRLQRRVVLDIEEVEDDDL